MEMQEVMTQVRDLIATLIFLMVVWIIKLVAKKLNLSISADEEIQIREKARAAIFKAEEAGAKLIKEGVSPLAADKLRDATSRLMERVPKLSEEEAIQIIHEELPLVGVGSAGKRINPPTPGG